MISQRKKAVTILIQRLLKSINYSILLRQNVTVEIQINRPKLIVQMFMFAAHLFKLFVPGTCVRAKLHVNHLFRVSFFRSTVVPGPIVQETFVRATYRFGIYLSGAH